MTDAKMDEVSRNSVWTEHCVKEARTLRLNETFGGIRSPSKMVILAEKPNRRVPTSQPTAEEVTAAKATLANLCIIKNEDLTPQEQFVLPVTSSQEYGFFHKPLVAREPMFHHPKKTCDVCLYADAYYTMTRRSPYARVAGP